MKHVMFLCMLSALALLIRCAPPSEAVTPDGAAATDTKQVLPSAPKAVYTAPCAVLPSADSQTLYVLENAQHQLRIVNAQTLESEDVIALPDFPTGMTLSRDSTHLYVTASCPAGVVAIVNLTTKRIEKIVPAGHSPCAPVLSPDNSVLAVCDRFANKVRFFKTADMTEYAVTEVPREPISAVFTREGDRLIVANYLPDDPSTKAHICAKVSFLEVETGDILTDVKLDNGAIELAHVALSPDGRYAFVPLVLARYLTPTTQIERGWVATNGVAIIDVEQEELYTTFLVDDPELGAANPSATAISPDGSTFCVLTSGSNEIITVPYKELMDKIAERQAAWADYRQGNRRPPPHVVDDMAFIRSMRTRRSTGVNGSRAMTFIGNNIYVTGYFSDDLSKVNIKRPAAVQPLVKCYGLPLDQQPDYRRGERYFCDANYCFQQWLTCHTCHPDGRADGLNWDLVNDGVGNPKNSRSMCYSIYNPPVMSTGIRKNAEYAIRSGMIYIQFNKLDDQTPEGKEVYGSIEAYYRAMKEVPSPYLTRAGELTAAAKRGEEVFAKAGCTVCHYGPYYSDLKKYDVGTAEGIDAEMKHTFKTPILNELWRTSPYMHDGRSASIHDIITIHNPGTRGHTDDLTQEEIDDLVEYILSL